MFMQQTILLCIYTPANVEVGPPDRPVPVQGRNGSKTQIR